MSNFADVQSRINALTQQIADEKRQFEVVISSLNTTITEKDKTIAALQDQLNNAGLSSDETDKVCAQLDQNIKDVSDIVP
jgi:uncharacterized coiled-coil protein SlyX